MAVLSPEHPGRAVWNDAAGGNFLCKAHGEPLSAGVAWQPRREQPPWPLAGDRPAVLGGGQESTQVGERQHRLGEITVKRERKRDHLDGQRVAQPVGGKPGVSNGVGPELADCGVHHAVPERSRWVRRRVI